MRQGTREYGIELSKFASGAAVWLSYDDNPNGTGSIPQALCNHKVWPKSSLYITKAFKI